MKDHQHIVCLRLTKNTGWQILERYKCKKNFTFVHLFQERNKEVSRPIVWKKLHTLHIYFNPSLSQHVGQC